MTPGEKLLLCQVLIEAQGTWGAAEGTCSSVGRMSFERTLSVASLGLFTEILSKTSPSLVLEIPQIACFLPKKDLCVCFFLMCYLEQIILHSYMVAVFFVQKKKVIHAHYGKFRKHRKCFKKKSPIRVLTILGHPLLSSIYFLL